MSLDLHDADSESVSDGALDGHSAVGPAQRRSRELLDIIGEASDLHVAHDQFIVLRSFTYKSQACELARHTYDIR